MEVIYIVKSEADGLCVWDGDTAAMDIAQNYKDSDSLEIMKVNFKPNTKLVNANPTLVKL